METATWLNTDELFQYSNIINKNDHDDETPLPAAKKSKVGHSKPQLEQCGLLSRQAEFNELGSPGPRGTCFGCWYIGEQEAGATSSQDIKALMDIIRKTISKTDPINLAVYLAERYERIQADVNGSLMPGEKPLPDWTPASILEHLRNHNTDPELQTWHRMVELQELAQIALNASVVRNPETNAVLIDEKQGKMYLEFVKQMETQSKSDPSKKLYYSGGNHIDMKTASEGPIAYSGKNIIDFWNNKKH